MEERGLLHKDKEDIIETLAADDVKEIDTSFETVFSEGSDREKEPRILESDEQIELLQEQIFSEDSVDFHESVSQESSPLLPSIPSADIEPNLSEELIREVIRELHENHILSIGDSLKVWRKAISNKLRSETLSKSWNTIILDEIQKVPMFNSHCDSICSFLLTLTT